MSIILTWENPEETYTPAIRRVGIWRGRPDPLNGQQIATDAAWGVFEDTQEIDVDQKYCVVYISPDDRRVIHLHDSDIQKYVRPQNSCKILFDMVRPDGMPHRGLNIEISNETEGANFYRRLLTNTSGHAEFFAVWGQRLLLRIDGKLKALDFVVPKLKEATWDDLLKWGSLIDTDERGYV